MLSADRFGLPVSTTLLEGGHWFTPEDVRVLTQAFERALGELGVRDRKDPTAIALAKLMIHLAAKKGERDPGLLCERAVTDVEMNRAMPGADPLPADRTG
jgi:hypothetical protein